MELAGVARETGEMISTVPEASDLPSVRRLLELQVDMQFEDLGVMLQLPRPWARLDSAMNLAATNLLFALMPEYLCSSITPIGSTSLSRVVPGNGSRDSSGTTCRWSTQMILQPATLPRCCGRLRETRFRTRSASARRERPSPVSELRASP
jgi:hypothetical protein